MITFNNTEIAFKHKSNKDLKQARRLFKLVAKPWIVKLGKKIIPVAFKLRMPISGFIKKTIFKQFCGGETIDECNVIIRNLYKNNVKTILDYSVEGQTEEKDFETTKEEILRTIDKSNNNPAIPFAVFKPSGIADRSVLEKFNDEKAQPNVNEKEAFARIVRRIDEICNHAYINNVPIFIDSEESWTQDALDRIIESMMARYNKNRCIVYNTFQMYRHDRLEFITKSIEKAKREGYKFGAKLVRGAYMEKERQRAEEMGYTSPIQKDKEATDADFDAAVALIVQEIDCCSLCCGTHNEESCIKLIQLVEDNNLSKNDERIYFAQLLGMSDHISFNLAHDGYNVTKYVPYGPVKEVMPYLLRRADENTSVAGQTGRELDLISKEWKRRKAKKTT